MASLWIIGIQKVNLFISGRNIHRQSVHDQKIFSSSVEYAIMIPNELEEDLLKNLIKMDEYITALKNWWAHRTKNTNS